MSEIVERADSVKASHILLTKENFTADSAKTILRDIKKQVKAGADFGEEAFPIIRALMYLDGLVLRTHPDVKLIESMGPYLEEFRSGLNLDAKINQL